MAKEARYAGFGVRLVAILLDTFMIITPITIFLGTVYGFEELNNPEVNPEIGAMQVLLYGLVAVISWVKTGQTPGQKAFGIIIVDATTQKTINYPQAILRFCMYPISLVTVIGILLPLFRKDKKALHDIVAHTQVRYVL